MIFHLIFKINKTDTGKPALKQVFLWKNFQGNEIQNTGGLNSGNSVISTN